MKGRDNRELKLRELLGESLNQLTEHVRDTNELSHLEEAINLLENAYRADVHVESHLNDLYSGLANVAANNADTSQKEKAAAMLEKAVVPVEKHLIGLYGNILDALETELAKSIEGDKRVIVNKRIGLVKKIENYRGRLEDITDKMETKDSKEGALVPEYFTSESAVARYLGINQGTFNQWVRQGKVELTKTERKGKLVYMRPEADAIKKRIITYPGGAPVVYDKPIFDLDWVMNYYGIKEEHLRSIRAKGLLKYFSLINRKFKERGKVVKLVNQYVYDEEALQTFEKHIIKNPEIAKQYGLKRRPVELVEELNGQADSNGFLTVHKYGGRKWVVREG